MDYAKKTFRVSFDPKQADEKKLDGVVRKEGFTCKISKP